MVRRKSKNSERQAQAVDMFAGALKQGMQLYQLGKRAEAEAVFQAILVKNPQHAHSLHMLGMIAIDVGKLPIAVQLIQSAIQYAPDVAPFHVTLGNVYRKQGRFDDAVLSYKSALGKKPNLVNALNNMAVALIEAGQPEDAIAAFRKAISYQPKNFDALHNLGILLNNKGEYQKAERYLKKAVGLLPDSMPAALNLVQAMSGMGAYDKALSALDTLIEKAPDNCVLLNKKALVFEGMGDVDAAIAVYNDALNVNPRSFETLNNLGALYKELSRFDEALNVFKQALQLQPDGVAALSNIAGTYKNISNLDAAIRYYKKALDVAPKAAHIYSNLLLAMVYAAYVSPQEFFDTARSFDKNIAQNLYRNHSFDTSCEPERKLRIGFVSPDFCDHAVEYFFRPVRRLRDKGQWELYAYSSTAKQDAVTEVIKQEVDHWRDIRHMSEHDAAELVRRDEIDILVDMAGHTAHNRLLVFAEKPAPVQVTWMGFAGTTGMQAIDYRISDPYAEPEGLTEHLNAEKLWRLPDIFCCYSACDNSPEVINHPPFEDNGYVTFGCFNNFAKVTDAVLGCWSKILHAVPDARLLLEIKGISDPQFHGEVTARLERLGLPIDRVTLEPRKKSNQFVLYNKIDIALDPYPCTGGTTSMDTVWMGVPFVSLAGTHFGSRMGVTILSNAGLKDLIAEDEADYVRRAVDLAQDKVRLRTMREGLRDKVVRSPIMDQPRFVRYFEEALRAMWRKFCAGNAPSQDMP